MKSILLSLLILCSTAVIGQTPDGTTPTKVKTDIWRDFKFYNNDDQSIKLEIPRVMNPNLSPNSCSGVSIPVGTEISFFNGRKKYLLVTITADTPAELNIDELVKARKKILEID